MLIDYKLPYPFCSKDQKYIIDVIEELAAVDTTKKFFDCTTGQLQKLLPHEIHICGMGNVVNGVDGPIDIYKLLGYNFPKKYLEEIFVAGEDVYDCPEITRWREKTIPWRFDAKRDGYKLDPQRLAIFNKYEFHNQVAHGVLDLQGRIFSYFTFLRMPLELGARELHLMKLLVPDMHAALARTVSELEAKTTAKNNNITERQKHILRLLHQGRTNIEISLSLDITIPNVKYHIAQIFMKLHANNRVQAVGKALDLGIISSSDRLLKAHLLEGIC